MIKPETVRYLNNLANMASSYAGATGSSVMAVEAYSKRNYARDFAARYEFPLEKLVLTPTAEPLNAILGRWLRGEGKGSLKDRIISRAFLRQLRRGMGEGSRRTLSPATSSASRRPTACGIRQQLPFPSASTTAKDLSGSQVMIT